MCSVLFDCHCVCRNAKLPPTSRRLRKRWHEREKEKTVFVANRVVVDVVKRALAFEQHANNAKKRQTRYSRRCGSFRGSVQSPACDEAIIIYTFLCIQVVAFLTAIKTAESFKCYTLHIYSRMHSQIEFFSFIDHY